jgi:hypothetical protein
VDRRGDVAGHRGGLGYGNRRWVAVGNEGPDAARAWSTAAPTSALGAGRDDQGTDFEFGLSSVAYGGGRWIAASSGFGARTAHPAVPVPGVLRVF